MVIVSKKQLEPYSDMYWAELKTLLSTDPIVKACYDLAVRFGTNTPSLIKGLLAIPSNRRILLKR